MVFPVVEDPMAAFLYALKSPISKKKYPQRVFLRFLGFNGVFKDEINDIVNEKRQRNIFSHIASLAGKIVAEISHDPLRLVVCDPIAKNVCYVTLTEFEVDKDGQEIKFDNVHFGRTALNASLVEVSIYQNPLQFLKQPDKYCIKFDSHQRGVFTLEG